MITVKVFDSDLSFKNFQFEIGKTYTIPKAERIWRCFSASAHCDISETLKYGHIDFGRYCLVDLSDDVKIIYYQAVGHTIKIIKELTFEECLSYDKTGEWSYKIAKILPLCCRNQFKLIEESLIRSDKTGKWMYRFAKDIKNANISKLEDIIIEKDKTLEWIYNFALHVKNANIKKLEKAIIKKDKTGYWCKCFYKYIKRTNKTKLKKAIEEKRRKNDNRKSI